MLAHANLLNTSAVFWEVVLVVIERGGPGGTWPASRAPPEALPRGFSWRLRQAVYSSDVGILVQVS
jgi:hypothetical protein